MLVRFLQFAVLLTLSSFAMAQQKSRQHADTLTPESTNCAVIFTSGTGLNETKFCVTVNGNIVQFSRGGDEYIRVGDFSEGYGICDGTTQTRYFDYANSDSGNWLGSTLAVNGRKAVSTRFTSDGFWQVTNTITNVLANGAGPGAAKVTMQIKNLTGITRNIVVLRFADVDYSQNGVDDFDNHFDFSADTAIGLEPGFRTGLSLTNNTFNFLHLGFAQSISGGPDPCDPLSATAEQPFVGDGSVVQAYGVEVPKNSSKTITVTYKPI